MLPQVRLGSLPKSSRVCTINFWSAFRDTINPTYLTPAPSHCDIADLRFLLFYVRLLCRTKSLSLLGCYWQEECFTKYGSEIYGKFLECFSALPVCAILSQQGQPERYGHPCLTLLQLCSLVWVVSKQASRLGWISWVACGVVGYRCTS